MRRLIVLAAAAALVVVPLVLMTGHQETRLRSAASVVATSSTTSTSSTTTSTAPPETSTTARSAVPTTSRSRAAVRPAPPTVAPDPPAPSAAGATAKATFYDEGQGTANGERFNPDGLTFAHRSMAFGTTVRFCHGGRCVVARCNDRGPFVGGVSFDLSRGAFGSIAPLSSGVITVTWEVV